jgi:hypothetical protein
MATSLLSGWKTSTPILPACRNAIRQHRRTMSARRLHRIGRDFPTICRAKMWRSILMSASVPAAVARDLNVIADGPAQSLHPLQKCSVADLHVRIVRCVGHERAHAPHGLALLRARRERPRDGRAARAWLRIFVVRCGLPCDPPVGGHSCNRGMIPRFHRAVCDKGRWATRRVKPPNDR